VHCAEPAAPGVSEKGQAAKVTTRVIQLELDSAWLDNPSNFGRFVQRVGLIPTVELNRIAVAARRLPRLYESGVRYASEPEWPERFRDAENVYHSGFGDCAQLAAWRVAELRERDGDKSARIAVMRGLDPGKEKLFHVVVRRGDGRIEDPSTILLGGR
jgi:hypothetical protein